MARSMLAFSAAGSRSACDSDAADDRPSDSISIDTVTSAISYDGNKGSSHIVVDMINEIDLGNCLLSSEP
jgi:hypothetical protein